MSLRDRNVTGLTQAERVLAAARSFRGTCQADWLADVTPDGGPRITRVAARLHELDGRGHGFECLGWRNKTKVFRLIDVDRDNDGDGAAHTAAPTSKVPVVVPVSAGSLFDIPVGKPDAPHYEDWRAA